MQIFFGSRVGGKVIKFLRKGGRWTFFGSAFSVEECKGIEKQVREIVFLIFRF